AYRIGMLVSGAGVLKLVAWLETQGLSKLSTWPIAYLVAAALVLVGLLAVLIAREPVTEVAPTERAKRADAPRRVVQAATGAFRQFLARDAAIVVLVFIIAYKLCDALAGRMTAPFVLSLGYDKDTYANIVKGVGLAASLIGGFAGGAVARAIPLAPAL